MRGTLPGGVRLPPWGGTPPGGVRVPPQGRVPPLGGTLLGGPGTPQGVPCWGGPGTPLGGYPAGGVWVPPRGEYPAGGVPGSPGRVPPRGGTLLGGLGTPPRGVPCRGEGSGYPPGGVPCQEGTLPGGGPCHPAGGGSYFCGVQAATELFCCELALYSLMPHGIMGNVAKHHGSKKKKKKNYGMGTPPSWTDRLMDGQTRVKTLPSRRTTYAGGNESVVPTDALNKFVALIRRYEVFLMYFSQPIQPN